MILEPLTGRRHQLRVHCHSLGHTILGKYFCKTHCQITLRSRDHKFESNYGRQNDHIFEPGTSGTFWDFAFFGIGKSQNV